MPLRFDRAELRNPRRTPEGYMLVDGIAATPGVYVYRDGNGRNRRELVTADMLANRTDLETLIGKPYTRRHHGLLDSTTVAPHAAGAVLDARYDDGVVVEFVVHRQDAIGAIEAGDHELSLGYDTTGLDETPGEHPEFGAYDVIQLGRTYNHLAGVPRGRSGREAAMRLDADDLFQEAPVFFHPAVVALIVAGSLVREDGAAADAEVTPETKLAVAPVPPAPVDPADKARQDSAADALSALLLALGVATVEEAQQKISNEWSVMCAARDALGGLMTLVGAENAEAAKAAITQMRADATKRMDAAPSDDALNAYASERVPLLERAVALGVAHDGKTTNVALRKAIACTIEPSARQDGSDDYYSGILTASHGDPWSSLRPRPGRDPRREDGGPPPVIVPDPYVAGFEERRRATS